MKSISIKSSRTQFLRSSVKLPLRIVLPCLLVLWSLDVNGQTALNSGAAAAVRTPQAAQNSGELDFQTDLFTGHFGYSVPLDLAPGRHGSAPSLALHYGSGGENGWCGVGWDLDLGYIERDGRKGVPVTWANGVSSSSYDDNKGFTFSLNGRSSSLLKISTGNYRAEIEGAFLQFQLIGNYWLVTDKSGNKYFFGQAATTRMSNSKTGWSPSAASGTFRWALDRIETVNGDVTTVTYQTFTGSPRIYPSLLSYNGHTSGLGTFCTVQFNLADRPDDSISCKPGFRVDLTKRLDTIEHKVNGAWVWKWKLNYTQSASTKRSMLTSINRYGTDATTSLPVISFGYSQQNYGFDTSFSWGTLGCPLSGPTTTYYKVIGQNQCDWADMDGDGLPDRVYSPATAPYTNWWVQLNNGTGFNTPVTWGYGYQTFNGGANTTYNTPLWSPLQSGYGRMFDINGDGRADRITDPYESYFNGGSSNILKTNYDRLVVELNGSTSLLPATSWTGVEDQIFPGNVAQTYNYRAAENSGCVAMMDINGDGLPDRVMTDPAILTSPLPVTRYVVQFNTGSGFSGTNRFGPFTAQGRTTYNNWTGLGGNVRLLDINGDGLPDRVMLVPSTTSYNGAAPNQDQTKFVVELNNGYGFETAVDWTGVDPCYGLICGGGTTPGYGSLGDDEFVALRDVNGDGLPDRIILPRCTPYSKWQVQLNNGMGFDPLIDWNGIEVQGQSYDSSFCGIQAAAALLMDLNGDGLPDRVMTKAGLANYFVAQFSKGPVPDFLTSVNNGIGGSVNVSYKLSTQYDNHDQPNGQGRQMLPFPVWTVSSLSVSDGIYPSNTTTYAYEGGFFNCARREFNGFAKVTVADPLGLTNVHWFHQAGGRDNSASGEWQDSTNALGKKGIEFRTETIGSDGKTYKLVLNKVDETVLSGGQHFANVSQTIKIDYPAGNATGARATAEQFVYDTSNGNLTTHINFGEVNSVNISGQSFSDIGSDAVYQKNVYTPIGGILDKPSQTLLASDSGFGTVLRETQCDYDSHGNLTERRDRICSGSYAVNKVTYDGYGNRWTETTPAGVVTVFTYDGAYHSFPVQQTVGSTLTTTFSYDARSGSLLSSTDPNLFVTANTYDVFLRLTETDVSTTPNGAASLWTVKYAYNLGGVSGGVPANYVRLRKNDDVDATNGHETWTYSDGFGRVVQVRTEAETGQFRVSDTVYDKRGDVRFVTLPYFGSGSSFTRPVTGELGTLTQLDPVGRVASVTSSVNSTFSNGLLQSTSNTGGDTGSPVGPVSLVYNDGSNPWVIVKTDAENKVFKYLLDAFGRTNQIVEPGPNTTTLTYDKAGVLVNVLDSGNNNFQYAYNNLGQLVAMADPDMGVWQYKRDYAGRVREQTDANGQLVRFNYDDPLGRLHTKQVYDFKGVLAYTITYVYDSNGGDSGFTVHAGELYKTIDKEGWEKFSYDLRGRTIKTARFLSKNGNTYTNQFSYDVLDRPSGMSYPNGGPTVTNTYDTGGNLSKVKLVGGSGTTFYTATGFDAVGALQGITFGNGATTSYGYYPNSKRLKNITSSKGSTLQNLTYSYDKVADVLQIDDGVDSSSAASARIYNVSYDDLHRLTSLTRPTGGQVSYNYNSIGNMTLNGEAGAGTYSYGTRMPHAIKSANGKSYAYDLNGNMLVRGTQHLEYDPEDRLILARTTNSVSTFGYSSDGARLWKQTSTTNGLQVWIDSNYEEKNGDILYHILAGGLIVCTFDSTATVFDYYQSDCLHSTAVLTDANGVKNQHYEYSAYGRDRFTESATAFPVSRRFTSQVKDEDTGLYFYGARYYDPELARFIQPDTIISDQFNPQTYNRYSYALNNPLRFTDPSGHEAEDEDEEIPETAGGVHALLAKGDNQAQASQQWGQNAMKTTAVLGEAAVNMTPVGTFNSGYGAVTGQDAMTHKELSGSQRLGAAGQTILGVIPALAIVKEAKVAGTIVKDAKEAADVAKVANTTTKAKEGTEVVQRVMSQAELKATQETGLLRGGRDGTHYATDAANSDALRAQQRLALKQTPEVRVTMEVPAGKFSPPSKVEPKFNMPGGGMERTASGTVPVKVLDVKKY